MARVTYISKRNISSGHSSGVEYDMDFTASRLQRRHNTTRRDQISLDGSTETLRYRGDEYYDVTINEIPHATMPLWREFIESVDGGEQFSFDAYGTYASPDNVETCLLESKNYIESRIQTTMIYNISFRVRVV